MNGADLTQFDPVTHIYSFDLAMPPNFIAQFVHLFNQSVTCRVWVSLESWIIGTEPLGRYVSYRSDLVSSFGLKATICEKVLMTMTTSSEDHTAYVYVRGTKGRAEDTYLTRTEAIQSLCTTLRVRLREPRSDDPETTCMHLVQKATRPLDQQVAELQSLAYGWWHGDGASSKRQRTCRDRSSRHGHHSTLEAGTTSRRRRKR
ncbi:hypothetical protein FOZ62_025985 [Perkinsus olseni]|uniref:Uncharacterized protein n=1 Tax=Perkinsus olseni TaxID=32597 RepID=A0A7J6RWP6_PEROL|nr:hypothetical protein FOZ62_025985 [Perkinsus olseni]